LRRVRGAARGTVHIFRPEEPMLQILIVPADPEFTLAEQTPDESRIIAISNSGKPVLDCNSTVFLLVNDSQVGGLVTTSAAGESLEKGRAEGRRDLSSRPWGDQRIWMGCKTLEVPEGAAVRANIFVWR
jgi:hypothetical protein